MKDCSMKLSKDAKGYEKKAAAEKSIPAKKKDLKEKAEAMTASAYLKKSYKKASEK
jgi:hypothetical protein